MGIVSVAIVMENRECGSRKEKRRKRTREKNILLDSNFQPQDNGLFPLTLASNQAEGWLKDEEEQGRGKRASFSE